MDILSREEKKVEYLELIYDLVFVYMVGRNNSLLEHMEGGFIAPSAFAAYIICTLAIIQIWNYTMYYINMFGRNGIRDHVFLCINMYLMYFIGSATRHDWVAYNKQYHIAWALILINIGMQYVIELRNHDNMQMSSFIKRMTTILFAEAVIIFAAAWTGPEPAAILSAAGILAGMVLVTVGKGGNSAASSIGKSDKNTDKNTGGSSAGIVDFAHLTERAMLYVVFTFGEMIIVLASYFEWDRTFNLRKIYFSLMAFLIVVGLFLSYEILYDHLLDTEKEDNGLMYMLIHIFIIFALNNITVSLEFMQEEHVALMPKMIFLVVSIVAYFTFLLMTRAYTRAACNLTASFAVKLLVLTAVYVILMLTLRENYVLHILFTVIYVFVIVNVLYDIRRRMTDTVIIPGTGTQED